MRTGTLLASALFVSTISASLHAQCALDRQGTSPLTAFSSFARFGASLDFDGDWGVVGAPEQVVGDVRSGAVTIFRRVGSEWIREQIVVGSDSGEGDDFGDSVALRGDLLAVGASRADLLGAVYLFRRVGGLWIEEQKITRLDLEIGDRFGGSVALDGDLLAISADFEDSAEGVNGAGSVNVYRTDGTSYQFEQKLTIADAGNNEGVGQNLDFGNGRIVIGTPGLRRVTVFAEFLGEWVIDSVLTASDSIDFDEFGSAVAIDGSFLAVGARRYDFRGAAYLFEESATGWTEVQKLASPTNQIGDLFGDAIDLAGDHLVVGARGVSSDHGRAFLYERNGGTFSSVATVDDPDLEPNGQLGNAVTLSGDEVWVGAWRSDQGLGAVFRRTYDGVNWLEASALSVLDTEPGDRFGAALATFGDTLLVGAPGNSSGVDLLEIGHVSIFTGDGPHWQRVGTLRSSSSLAGERFGAAVAVTDDLAVVGAPRALGAAPETGALSIFERMTAGSDPDEWLEVARLTDPTGQTGDRLGATVASSGTRVVAGAPGRAGPAGAGVGAVALYEQVSAMWSASPSIDPQNAHPDLEFGAAVSLSGDRLLVGAPGDNTLGIAAGRVDAFEFVGGSATFTTSLTLPGGITGDRFGAALSLDGDLLAVGAPGSAASPPNRPGQVAIYRFNGATWGFETVLLPPTSGEGRFGASVSVSGGRVLIGEPGPTDTGAGRAHAFEEIGGNWFFVATFEQDPEAGDELGHAVALSDSGSAFVGAPGDTFTFVRSGLAHQFWSLLEPDCDGDGVSDICIVENEIDTDCNGNGIPDDCDLATLSSVDLNGNGRLDDCEAEFIRGDCNLDGTQDIADAIWSLHLLFSAGVASPCPAACDTNGDDLQNIADAITTLNFLFDEGTPPPAPFPACGLTPGQLKCDLPAAPGCR